MAGLLASELFRLARRPMTRALLAILVVAVAALYLVLWSVLRAQGTALQPQQVAELRDQIRPATVRSAGLSLVYQVGTVLAVILAASLIASEFGWGTIRTLLPRAPGRAPFIAAKLLVLALFVAALVLVGYLTALAASLLLARLEHLDMTLGGAVLPRTLAALARTWFVMLPYLALAFLLALWFRSTAPGIGIGLAVLFLESLVTGLLRLQGGVLGRVPEALLAVNVQAVLAANATGLSATMTTTSATTTLPDAWRAAAVLAVYTVAFVALALWRFLRRDITAL
jgi:ABC-2 type transport system permease protein